jgi:DNA-binding transcriptional LysR family regulator
VLIGLCAGILPTFFVAAEIASGSLVTLGPTVVSESAYYFVYPARKREYYPLREFSQWLASEIAAAQQ